MYQIDMNNYLIYLCGCPIQIIDDMLSIIPIKTPELLSGSGVIFITIYVHLQMKYHRCIFFAHSTYP